MNGELFIREVSAITSSVQEFGQLTERATTESAETHSISERRFAGIHADNTRLIGPLNIPGVTVVLSAHAVSNSAFIDAILTTRYIRKTASSTDRLHCQIPMIGSANDSPRGVDERQTGRQRSRDALETRWRGTG